MRVHSYTICHYGVSYLPYALRSVYDQVDQLHVVYTSHPSHGHRTDQPPPETREEIIKAAFAYDPQGKIRWYETDIWQEGPQRDRAVQICQEAGAEMVLVVDCDEVWPYETLRQDLAFAQIQNKARNWLVNMLHFWRSFNWACSDNNWPVRIIDLRHKDSVGYLPQEFGRVWHFGYAVRDKIQKYKWQIHGHKDEGRPDWFEEKWDPWPPAMDCHPTNDNNWWMPEPFDKALLPEFMREHPFHNLERIE